MPTTTNFGWTTPADTDLVSAGAAAMRTLGSGVDTSFVGLKGGLTGQALVKSSSTDLAYSWEANGWYQLATATLTTQTTNLSALPTTYKDLRIVINGAVQATAPVTSLLRIGNGSASSSGYQTVKNPFSGTWTGSTTATDVLGSGISATSGSSIDIICDLPQYAEVNLIKTFMTQSLVSSTGQVCFGHLGLNAAINYVSFNLGATPTAGTITVYGRM